MQARELLEDFPKQQLVYKALQSIIILLTKTDICSIPGSYGALPVAETRGINKHI